jgi:hypothetical protein
MSITPEAIQSLFGSVKAKPVAGLERTATTPIAFIEARKRHDSATGPEDL